MDDAPKCFGLPNAGPAETQPLAPDSTLPDAAPPASSPERAGTDKAPVSCVREFIASRPVTSLDTLETSVVEYDEHHLCTSFRHSGWAQTRRRVWEALKRTGQSSSRISQFESCGRGCTIEQSDIDPNRFRIRGSGCHDRLCTPCALERSRRLADAAMALIQDVDATFVTLTLCGQGEPLTDLIDRLYRHFRALRVHPVWAESVKGGAAFLEVKWSDKAQRWHPHLHVLCDARYIPQDQLSRAWHSITRDSFIVDIRKVREKSTSASYVTKYASKPLNSSFSNTPKLLDEAIQALKGRRLCMCFGEWYGSLLSTAEDVTLADDEVDAGTWHFHAFLEEILQDANSGDRAARWMITALGVEAKWRSSLTPSMTPPPRTE